MSREEISHTKVGGSGSDGNWTNTFRVGSFVITEPNQSECGFQGFSQRINDAIESGCKWIFSAVKTKLANAEDGITNSVNSALAESLK